MPKWPHSLASSSLPVGPTVAVSLSDRRSPVRPKYPQAPKLHAARKPLGALLLVVSILSLTHDQRRILHAKVQSVTVAPLRITLAWSGRVAVEDGEQP
jgi:hypothetical protein